MKSRVRGDFHARFCERVRVKLPRSTRPLSFQIKPVTIGCDCWIGSGARILAGVTIGNGAVIGANAVVTHNIPDFALAVGVPARVIKYRE